MRSFLLVGTAVLATSAVGCTLDPTAHGVEVHPRLPFTSAPQSVVTSQAWSGEPILVDVEHGNVEVVGERNASGITVRADTLTWADNADDARGMSAALLAKVSVTREGGTLVVRCAKADHDVGSALADASQCNVRVEIPAPDGVVHDVRAYAEDGFTYLNRLESGPGTQIVATGIEVEGLLLRGNVAVHAGWADVEAEPIAGASILVESTTDDWYAIPSLQQAPKREPRDGSAKFGATLRIPSDFRAARVDLSSAGASVDTSAFPDVVSGQARGPLGPTAAALVTVKANQGNATLLPAGQNVTLSRQGDFGTDTRDPWGTT
jgi:hypothetical protein